MSGDFQQECVAVGAACAAARFRFDEKGPEPYRKAFLAYRGPKNFPRYFVRKWLSLRLSAIKRGMVVDQTVTPALLKGLTDGRCPVTLETFDMDGKSPMNPSVDRLVNEVSYRAGNICVLSMRANRAKGERTFEEVAQLAQAGEPHAGLEPIEWMRLASLMYGAWSRAYKHEDPYLLPLAAIPGQSMFMSTSQVVQWLLTRHYGSGGSSEAATEKWLQLTGAGGGGQEQFLALREKLANVLSSEKYAGNAWLHGDVFEAFVEWFNSCHRSVIPIVETLLQEHQQQLSDAVAVLEWPTAGRYRD